MQNIILVFIFTHDKACNSIECGYWAKVGHSGKMEQTYLKNVLHVPTITKNLVSVGQIVEQGMQVRFDQGGCFIEKEGQLTARRWREGQMFILDSHEMKLAMFAKGTKADTDIELWHKIIVHINLNKLKAMQSKGVVIGDWRGMWSLPIQQATPTPVPEREEREQMPIGCNSFQCMGTG